MALTLSIYLIHDQEPPYRTPSGAAFLGDSEKLLVAFQREAVNVKDRFSFADPNLPNGLTLDAKVKRSHVELNRGHDPVMGIDRGAEWKPGKGARGGSRRHWRRLTQPLAPAWT